MTPGRLRLTPPSASRRAGPSSVRAVTDEALRARMEASLVASWAALAAVTPGAAMAGRAAVFPAPPHRAIFNNALARPGGADVVAAMCAYAAAGVERFAVWIDEDDAPARAVAHAHGLVEDEATRQMALALDDLAVEPLPFARGAPDPAAVEALNGVPSGLTAGAPFGVVVAEQDGDPAAGAMWHDHDGDRTILLVATAEHARRRGLATAIVADLLLAARAAGCTTASLQASPMAERLYAQLGFRDLGRYVELVPG